MESRGPRAGRSAVHLFVYGSLVDPRRLDDVLGYHFLGERLRARLAGYERLMSESFGYPFLVARAEHVVDGILIMDLSPNDMDVLDRYEDVDVEMYTRVAVEVETWGCGPSPTFVQAHTYVAGVRLQSTLN
jgi:gamma-glutamylcyclotransferase (GGCT)/AIG2-like uncharacterized protein YtfP